jgi:hypothetical protein
MSRRHVFESIEQMLEPDRLSELIGGPVTRVVTAPLCASDGKSGSHFLSVGVDGRQRFVLKRLSRDWDWSCG